jgi:cysteine synthase A
MPAATSIRSTRGRGRLFDSVLDTVGDTPVIRVNNLGIQGRTIYVKAEFFNPASSVKDRLALNVIEAAERAGVLRPGQTVVEATSGNTGIGLAMVCAQKCYPLVVTMADSFSVERRKLMRMLGAKVVLTPRAHKGFGMYQKAVELAKTHGWFLARQFETKANADIHESTTAREIINDFAGQRLDVFVTGYGTGGTVAGVARVLRRERPQTRIVLCEPANAQLVGSGVPQQRAEGGAPAARQPSGMGVASDPGLDPRLHPCRAPRGDRLQVLRRGSTDRRRGRDDLGEAARPERRHFHRDLWRIHLCSRSPNR